MGPPKSGKGMITRKLTSEFGYNLICSGDLLRSEKDFNPKLESKISNALDKGDLVSDGIINKLMLNEFQKASSISQSFLIDGYPRTLKQSMNLERMIKVSVVLWLNISDETSIDRSIKKGVTEDTAKQRLIDFKDGFSRIRNYYTNVIVDIDGEGSIDDVYKRIIDTLFETVKEERDASSIINS